MDRTQRVYKIAVKMINPMGAYKSKLFMRGPKLILSPAPSKIKTSLSTLIKGLRRVKA